MARPLCTLVIVFASACGSDSGQGGTAGAGGGVASGGSSSGGAPAGGGVGGSSGTSGGGAGGAGTGGAVDGGVGGAVDAGPSDPCPTLAIPPTCFGREVMYREWGASAVGDGSYFASQAPHRLGFNRVKGRIWIVKFQVEANTYMARVSAYGDSSGGVAWISNTPCDAVSAAKAGLVAWGVHGGGSIDFTVAKDEAHSQKLLTDPAYTAYSKNLQLRGGHCYYLAFENTAEFPSPMPDATYISTATDDCGVNGDGTCYYLAMDFSHRLHDITTGQTSAWGVIPGLTQ